MSGWTLRDDDPKPRGGPVEREPMTDAEAAYARAIRQELAGKGGRLPEYEVTRALTEDEARALDAAMKAEPVVLQQDPPMPNADVIALIRKTAGGSPFVRVDKLVAALS